MLHPKKYLSLFVVMIFLFVGCMSRTPVLTDTYTPIDKSKSCDVLLWEIQKCDNEMQTKLAQKKKKSGNNVALGVVGALLFWPALFFMDFSDADKAEYESLRKRHDYLVSLSMLKKCGVDIEPAKSLEDMMREEAEKRKDSSPKADDA